MPCLLQSWTWPLCKYRDMFGKPGTGQHAFMHDIGGIAWVDVISVLVGAVAMSWMFCWSVWNTAVCLFLVGILVHRLFCVRTTIDKLLFY